MEGSQGVATSGQQGAEGGAAESQGPDIGAVLQEFQSGQAELRDLLQTMQLQQPQAQAQPEAVAEPSLADADLSFLDQSDPDFDPQQVAVQLGELFQQTVQQQIAPLNEQIAEQRREQQARDLAEEFPELEDPQVANELITAAQQWATEYNRPDLANDPPFWRLVFMAQRAAALAASEGAESAPGAAHLEGGGGALPSGSQGDLGDAIVAEERGGRSVLPF